MSGDNGRTVIVNASVKPTPGISTTEYAVAKGGTVWGVVAVVIGVVIATASSMTELAGENSTLTTVFGAIVTIGGIVQTTIVKLAYMNGRAQVKTGTTASRTETETES